MAGPHIRLNSIGGMNKAPAAPKMPSFSAPATHVASMVGADPMHSYLGHFNNKQFLTVGHNTSGHWIEGAIKHPGAERKAAARSGMSTHAYMEKNKSKGGTAGKRARLGLTLEGMHHGK